MTQKLIAPEGMTSITFQDESYEVEDGLVEVPAEAVADLASHGFKPWFPKPKGGGKKAKAPELVGDQNGEQSGDENQGQDNLGDEGDQGGDQNGEE